MKNEFVPYVLAVKLKELGFEEKCFCNWEESWSPEPEDEIRMVLTTDQTWLRPGWIRAPLFQQAFRWFREKYGLFVSPNVISYEDGPYLWFFEINSTVLPFGTDLGETDDYKTYEEAELECLDKLIEIVTKQQEQ